MSGHFIQMVFHYIQIIYKTKRTEQDASPESRARPRATQQGCAKCGGTSLCQRSGHRKKPRRKEDKKQYFEIYKE